MRLQELYEMRVKRFLETIDKIDKPFRYVVLRAAFRMDIGEYKNSIYNTKAFQDYCNSHKNELFSKEFNDAVKTEEEIDKKLEYPDEC